MRRIEVALEGAERIAGARHLDLDHLGAEVGEQHAGGRAGDEGAHVEHADAFKRSCHSSSSPTHSLARSSRGVENGRPFDKLGSERAWASVARASRVDRQGETPCASASRTRPTPPSALRTRTASPCAGATWSARSSARWISPATSGCWSPARSRTRTRPSSPTRSCARSPSTAWCRAWSPRG